MSQINITSGTPGAGGVRTYARDVDGNITVTGKKAAGVTVTVVLDSSDSAQGEVAGTGLPDDWTKTIAASVGLHTLVVSGGDLKRLTQSIEVVGGTGPGPGTGTGTVTHGGS